MQIVYQSQTVNLTKTVFEIIIQTSNEYLKQFTSIILRERSYSNTLNKSSLYIIRQGDKHGNNLLMSRRMNGASKSANKCNQETIGGFMINIRHSIKHHRRTGSCVNAKFVSSLSILTVSDPNCMLNYTEKGLK
ncbi:hypothetical protein V8G54_015770 [Vigna mungo]|uniref:Uncharacterized protein n=1 Tax=Vigna mungo TaxID=3915 RepID=A0AAQ3NK11_VIGMU